MLSKLVESKTYAHNEIGRPIRGINYRGSTADTIDLAFIITSEADEINVRNPYHDRWEGDYFKYTGEGQKGNQELKRGNLALSQQQAQGFPLHLFSKLEKNKYRYDGRFNVVNIGKEKQKDVDEKERIVYLFNLKKSNL